jgi:uncharacterized protein YkwD
MTTSTLVRRNTRLTVQVVAVGAGSSVLTLEDGTGTVHASINVTIAPRAVQLATVGPEGVHLAYANFFTQSEIRQIIPRARSAAETRHAERHPFRQMTEREFQAWIKEYNDRGGINSFELEVLYLLNRIRITNGLEPFTLCPVLSMASRLHAQLGTGGQVRQGNSHYDMYYGGPASRRELFLGMGYLLPTAENSSNGYTTAEGAVDGWMNSPPHRDGILNPYMNSIGIGRFGLVTTTKFSSQGVDLVMGVRGASRNDVIVTPSLGLENRQENRPNTTVNISATPLHDGIEFVRWEIYLITCVGVAEIQDPHSPETVLKIKYSPRFRVEAIHLTAVFRPTITQEDLDDLEQFARNEVIAAFQEAGLPPLTTNPLYDEVVRQIVYDEPRPGLQFSVVFRGSTGIIYTDFLDRGRIFSNTMLQSMVSNGQSAYERRTPYTHIAIYINYTVDESERVTMNIHYALYGEA